MSNKSNSICHLLQMTGYYMISTISIFVISIMVTGTYLKWDFK